MTDKKISAMTAAGNLTGAELVPLVQGGANVQTTVTNIGASILDGFGAGNVSIGNVSSPLIVGITQYGETSAYVGPGNSSGTATAVVVAAGANSGTGYGGYLSLQGGASTNKAGFGGSVTVQGGAAVGTAGDGQVFGGESSAGRGGGAYLQGGDGVNANGSPVGLTAGAANGGNHTGGDVTITVGAGVGTGRSGVTIFSPTLPGTDPHVAGALYQGNISGNHTVLISQG